MQSPKSGGVRFAPSPTGKFHIGNLRTAWISYKFAKLMNRPWVVRFEDIDQPRVVKDARENQLSDLLKLKMTPDIELLQSEFRDRHWDCFEEGIRQKQIYPCDCSRKEVQQALSALASAPHVTPATYSGRCRSLSDRELEATETIAWRFKMSDDSGKDDFIVARTSKSLDAKGFPTISSFTPAYHFACAIDDHDGDYDLLVRSSDLRDSLYPQRAIQKWLGRTKPIPVFHTSLVVQNDGKRLEKRTSGVTLFELESKNVSAAHLIDIFDRSFLLPSLELSTDSLFGEKSPSLKLADLGL